MTCAEFLEDALKNILKTTLANMTQFKALEFIIIANNEEGETIATGIDPTKSMMITANMGSFTEFDTMMCLGNLNFLKKIFDQEQIMGSKGTMELLEGESFQGDDIFTGIKFAGPRLTINYSAVDPRVLKERARLKKFPPLINKMEGDLVFSVEPTIAEEFRQAAMLQKMMATKDDAVVKIIHDGDNLVFRLPYSSNSIDLIMTTGVKDDTIVNDLRFDAEKMERVIGSILNYANGDLTIGGSFLDIKYTGDGVSYHIRLPKKTIGVQV